MYEREIGRNRVRRKEYVEFDPIYPFLLASPLCAATRNELQCNSRQQGGMIMAANQLVQTRIDGAIKEEAASVLAAMGLTVSDAVRMLLTKIAHDHALPFDPLVPSAVTIAAMKEARAGNLPRANSIEELKRALRADD